MVFVCFANIGRVDRLPTFAISNHGRFAASVADDLGPSDLAAAVSESPRRLEFARNRGNGQIPASSMAANYLGRTDAIVNYS
jgi:hypothetical protein